MTVVVQTSINPTIDGSPIQVGDEIGVFTPGGELVGASIWTGSNIAITVWGNDKETDPVTDGIKPGETLHFRMWDASATTEYDAIVTYSSGGSVYSIDGISVLATLVGMAPPVITVDPSPLKSVQPICSAICAIVCSIRNPQSMLPSERLLSTFVQHFEQLFRNI